MKKRSVGLFVALFCCLLSLSCGSGVNSPHGVTVAQSKIGTLFGADEASPNSVYAMNIFSDGTVAPVAGSPFAADATTYGLVAAPSSGLLFVTCMANFLNTSMSVFNISANGRLRSAGPAINASAYTLSLTADEKFLLVQNHIFQVSPASGSLIPVGNLSVGGGVSDTFSPDGHFVLVAGGGSSTLDSYSFDQLTGGTQLASSTSGFFMTLPTPPIIYPSSKFVYVPYSSGMITPGPPPPGGIAGFALAADGHLTPIAGSPFALGLNFGSSVGTPFVAAVIDPQGKHLYAETAKAVYGFDIDQTSGALSPIAGAFPFFSATSTDNPIALTFDASGRFLFMFVLRLVPGGIASYLNSYSVGSNGVPQLVPGGPFRMGNEINSMAAIP